MANNSTHTVARPQLYAEETPKAWVKLFFPSLMVILFIGLHAWQQFDGSFLGFLGVKPRTLEGLIGIVGMPFVHGSWEHVLNNSVPLLVLGWALFRFYPQVSWQVIGWSWLVSGLGVWLFGRTGSNHIGASGLVYAYASFVFFSGMLRANKRLIALSLLVVVEYGGMVWGVFPIKEGVSWEGHLFGALAGFFLAIAFKKYGPQREVHFYDSEDYKEEYDDVEWDDWKLPQDRVPQGQPMQGQQPEDPKQRKVVVRYIYRRRPPKPAPPHEPGQQHLPPNDSKDQ